MRKRQSGVNILSIMRKSKGKKKRGKGACWDTLREGNKRGWKEWKKKWRRKKKQVKRS